MKQHTDQEERRGLIANLFAKAPRVPDPAPVPPPARPQAPARREPDPTPAEEAALRRRAQEWQQSYDRQQSQRQSRRQSRHNGHGAHCAPSGTCTPTRFHVTGHPNDEVGHEQCRPGFFARLFGARDKGIGRGDGS